MQRRLLRTMLAVVVFSAVFAAVAGAQGGAPVNTAAPVVSGQPYVGKTLTTTNGGWQHGPTGFTYQWVRCDPLGNNCNQISGATMRTYIPTSADVNHRLESWVTASNSSGTSGPVNSKPTSVITPALPPKNTTAPTIIGKPLVGGTLFANPGSYSGGAVTSFSYQWQRCDSSGGSCSNIPGATGQSYGVVSADKGQTVRVRVKASNPFGSITTTS